MPSLCAVVAPGFQYEGLGGLFFQLPSHTKHSLDLFIQEAGKLREVMGWSGIKFNKTPAFIEQKVIWKLFLYL